MSRRGWITQVARSLFFDDSNTTYNATTVQEALEAQNAAVGVSASPGFSFGRSANVGLNTWLVVTGSVPSNKAGITVALANPEITQIFVGNEDISTFDITVYEHEGDEVNLTSLGTVSVVAMRSDTFDVSFSVTSGRQLAVRVTSGSAKNLNVGLQLKGNIA